MRNLEYMLADAKKYVRFGKQRGFTLLEAAVASSLAALILIALYVALGEGMDISRDVAKQQDTDRSLNNILLRFGEDIRSAQYFYAGTVSTVDGGTTLDPTPKPREITFAVSRNDGSLAWLKYELIPGIFTGDTYLIRLSDLEDPTLLSLTYVAHDVADLDFYYYDTAGVETSDLTEAVAVELVIVIDSGVAVKRRDFYFKLRNQNKGLMAPPWDFDSERDSQILK
jgi:hypothetical protein